MYPLMSVRPETTLDKTRQDFSCERSTTGHVTVETEFPGGVPHVKRTSS